MSNQFSLLLLFALISSIISDYASPKPYAYPIPPTRQSFRQQFSNNDFVFDLNRLKFNCKIQFANLASFPALSGEGLSFALVTLDPCAVNLPYVTPRASEVIYVISGEFLRVGFSEENGGRTIVNDLEIGQVKYYFYIKMGSHLNSPNQV